MKTITTPKHSGLKIVLIVGLLVLAFVTRWQWVASTDLNQYPGSVKLSDSQTDLGGQRIRKQSYTSEDEIEKISAFYTGELKRTGWIEITTKFNPDFSGLTLQAFRSGSGGNALVQLTTGTAGLTNKNVLIELEVTTDLTGSGGHQH